MEPVEPVVVLQTKAILSPRFSLVRRAPVLPLFKVLSLAQIRLVFAVLAHLSDESVAQRTARRASGRLEV